MTRPKKSGRRGDVFFAALVALALFMVWGFDHYLLRVEEFGPAAVRPNEVNVRAARAAIAAAEHRVEDTAWNAERRARAAIAAAEHRVEDTARYAEHEAAILARDLVRRVAGSGAADELSRDIGLPENGARRGGSLRGSRRRF